MRNQTEEQLLARIKNYLVCGGLFNPESMEHDAVRDLIMDLREYLYGKYDAKAHSEAYPCM